jgi:blue copper oxidase
MSQELVMNMFRDKEGMMALEKTGLMAMGKNGQIDPAVIARVVDLIVNGPALPQSEQLSANGVNGKSF